MLSSWQWRLTITPWLQILYTQSGILLFIWILLSPHLHFCQNFPNLVSNLDHCVSCWQCYQAHVPLHLVRASCDTKWYTRSLCCSFNLLIYCTLLEIPESINRLVSDISLLTHVGVTAENSGARAGKPELLIHSRLLCVLTVCIT